MATKAQEPNPPLTEKSTSSGQDEPAETAKDAVATDQKPKSSIMSTIKANFDIMTLLLMFKASLPPVIVLCFYQSDTGANMLGSLGYLSAIISILTVPMLPRAKFLQNIFATATGAAFGAALGTLIVYATVQARLHTSAPIPASAASAAGGQVRTLADTPYNSSASAVSATFFFFGTYCINVMRSKLPQIQFAVLSFSILTVIICAEAPLIPSVAAGLTFIKTLLKAFFFGLGMGTGVALFFLPISCRWLIHKQFSSYLDSIKTGLQAHRALFGSFREKENLTNILKLDGSTPESEKVRATATLINELNGKLQIDLPFAKREVGIGKMGPDELKQLNKLSRLVSLPVLGLASVADVLNQFAQVRGWKIKKLEDLPEEEQAALLGATEEWAENYKLIYEPCSDIIDVLVDGIEHVQYQLQLKARPKTTPKSETQDVEGAPDRTAPGEPGFAKYLDDKSTIFYTTKHLTLIEWARARGFEFPDNFFDSPESTKDLFQERIRNTPEGRRHQNQRQVYLLLYMEFLLYSTSRSLLDLVIWADEVQASGLLKKNRLIIPSFKRIRKLIGGIFSKDELATHDGDLGNVGGQLDYKVSFGASFDKQRDPEHLPPRNAIEKVGNFIRLIPKVFKSSHSTFGFRAAIASLSIGIIMFLEQTQRYSYQYRLFWAVIMTAISMSPSAGQFVFGFLLRVAATTIAMCVSWFSYYVPGNGKTPGVLVFYWFFVFISFWLPIKKPQLAILGIITVVTLTLTIGYELEKNKIGSAALEASGQPYLSPLLIAPVRLATVSAGLFVAFIWTVFPYPTEEHTILRRDVAASLHLLASYYSIIHETVSLRIRRIEGDPNDKHSPGRKLESSRLKMFTKQILLISSMRMNTIFSKFEFNIGGRFPRERYVALIDSIESITRYMSLIGYASVVYREDDAEAKRWSSDFRRLMSAVKPVTHENTLIFSILSGSMLDSRPLPPYCPKPKAFALAAKLESLDPNILSVSHINEPGYAAFAVIQLASRCVGVQIDRLIEEVQELVGTMDFSITIDEADHLDELEKKID